MAKPSLVLLFVLVISITICSASPARERLRVSKLTAPYPAAGFKPDIPFELPTQPDNTYLPPVEEATTTEASLKDEVEEIATEGNNEQLEEVASEATTEIQLTTEIPATTTEETDDESIPTQTPYPPAGFQPDIPFEFPAQVRPDNTYLPPPQTSGVPTQTPGVPAQTYGTPEVNVKNEVEEIDVQSAESSQPGESENDIADDEGEQVESEIELLEGEEDLLNPHSERIVFTRSNARKPAKLRSAKLQVAPKIYLVNYNGQLYRL